MHKTNQLKPSFLYKKHKKGRKEEDTNTGNLLITLHRVISPSSFPTFLTAYSKEKEGRIQE